MTAMTPEDAALVAQARLYGWSDDSLEPYEHANRIIDRIEALSAELAKTQAVIAAAPHDEDCETWWNHMADHGLGDDAESGFECTCWKSWADTSVFDAALAQAKAEALRDAADALTKARKHLTIGSWLRGRAAEADTEKE